MDILAYFPEWLLTHGAALVVVLPLLFGAICAVLPSEKLAWVTTLVVAVICTLTAAGLFLHIYGGKFIEPYHMGGWVPRDEVSGGIKQGIEYVIDGLNTPIIFLICAMALLTTVYGLRSVVAEVEPKKRAPFYGAFLMGVAGLLGMVATGDAFNVFVFLEVSSISTYALVAMGASRDRRALSAAYNYLILGSIGATFFVIGLGFLYMETGTLNMLDIGEKLRAMDGGSRVSMVAFGFIVVGLGLKLAMFPLHMWLPGAYAHAPSMVTVFLASTATKAALYLLLRFTFVVFDYSFDYVFTVLTYLITGLGVAAMLLGSLQAIFQTDARRTLAYSSIAQVGYMLLGVGMITSWGLTAGYVHLLNHAVIKGALFFALGAFWYRFGITRTEDFAGLGKTMPWTMMAFTIGGLSLIGVPLTAGFISKIQLAEAAFDRGWGWAVAVIMLSSILAIFYIGRLLLAAYFQEPPEVDGQVVERNEAPLVMLIPMWFLALLSIGIGVYFSDAVVETGRGAAEVLMLGGRP